MDLCDALRRALYRVEVETLRDVFDRFSIRELALMFLGRPTDARNVSRIPGYLSTRRTLERYRAGVGAGPRGGRQTRAPRDLEDFLDSLRERIQRRRPPAGKPLDATIRGDVKVSKDRRRRKIGPLELPAPCIEQILDALDQDDCDAAEEAFAECFGQAAGMGATPIWYDVDELTLR